MINQTDTTEISGRLGNAVPASQDFDFPDSSPREVPEDEGLDLTRILMTPDDLGQAVLTAQGVELLELASERVRSIAEVIRHQVHVFVQENIRPPSQIGLLAKPSDPISVSELIANCRQACADLEQIFEDRGDGSSLSINVRTFAHRVQSSLEIFLLSLVRRQVTEGIGDAELGEVLHECIGLKGDLATTMQQIDAMNAGIREALAAHYQALVQRSRSNGSNGHSQ